MNLFIFLRLLTLVFFAVIPTLFAEDGVVASLEIKEAGIKAGDPVEVYLKVVNNTKISIDLNVERWPRFFYTNKMKLIRTDEEPIEMTFLGKKLASAEENRDPSSIILTSGGVVSLAPKGVYKYKMTISGLFDLTKPGKYTFVVPTFSYTIKEVENTIAVAAPLEFIVD